MSSIPDSLPVVNKKKWFVLDIDSAFSCDKESECEQIYSADYSNNHWLHDLFKKPLIEVEGIQIIYHYNILN